MEPIGIAVVGASNRSSMIFHYLRDHPREGFIAGAYDLLPSRCEWYFREYDLSDATVYGSLDEAVNDPRVGAVFVGTWDAAHAEPAIAALQAGKHVYCEKPLATTLDDCDRIIDVARDAETVFYVGMNLRHGPVHEKLHEVLQSGTLGKLLTIEANEYYIEGRSYFRRWNRLREFGGGLWITKACHDFDLLNWFAGGKPTRVSAFSNLSHYRPRPEAGTHCRDCPVSQTCEDYLDYHELPELVRLLEEQTGTPSDLCLYNSDKDTFDNGQAMIEYDNDVRASYTCNVVTARSTRQMNLMGTEGSAEADMKEGLVKVWRRFDQDVTVHDVRTRIAGGHGGADIPILQDFFRCCRTGDKPRSSWADGRMSVQVGLAARQSCDTGQTVHLD